uniref:Integrase catalytic domain-containing protein n=1 Tax=Trichuris muris TaxID=70415 RepID=A0A5S6QBJ1_TRIMR
MQRSHAPPHCHRQIHKVAEAIPLHDTSSLSCGRAFIAQWVARFGVPVNISSDRGAQFTSGLWSAMAQLLGMNLHRTTSYHPQANGLVERFHRHLKSALMARLTGPDWMDELPWVLLGIRTAPKEHLKTSSAELVFGAPLTVPGDFIPTARGEESPAAVLNRLREKIGKLAPIPTCRHGATTAYVPNDIHKSQHVFLRRDAHRAPLQKPYEGPFTVLQHGFKNFVIDLGGRPEKVSIDRLKPAHLDMDQPVQLFRPRRRGRPPKVRDPPPYLPPVTHSDRIYSRSGRPIRKPRHLLHSVLEGGCVADSRNPPKL